MSEKTEERYEVWFGIPVCVQLRAPYALPVDAGPVEVSLTDGTTRSYGVPVVRAAEGKQQDPPILMTLSGELQPDGHLGLMMYIEINGTQLRIALDPKDIAYITVMPNPKSSGTILAP